METLPTCPAPSVHRSPRRRIPDRRRSPIGLTVLLVLVLAILASACGGSSSSDETADAPAVSGTPEPATPADPAPAAPQPGETVTTETVVPVTPDQNDEPETEEPETEEPESEEPETDEPETVVPVTPDQNDEPETDEEDAADSPSEDRPAQPASVPTVTPEPTAAPTPGAPVTQAVPPVAPPVSDPGIRIGCNISPQRQVVVGEHLVYTATQSPGSPAVAFTFDHGDGTLDDGVVSRAYYRNPGSYPVHLNWSYGRNSGRLLCGTVKVVANGAPAPAPTPSPTPTPAGPAGVSITCGIAPKGPVEVNEQVTLSAGQFPGNVPIAYTFDHGDGTRDAGPLSYANYVVPGSYAVKLTWSYNGTSGTIDCGTVKVVPAAATSVSVRCGISPRRDVVVGERLTFAAEHTPAYANVSYAFDHGDGTIDRRQVSTAYYDAVGTYAVTLRWSSGNRSGTIDCGIVRVVAAPSATPVTISCSISKREVRVGEIVTLTASQNPQGVPVTYAFDHGDGTVDRTPRSQAYYDRPGAYDVLLHWTSGPRTGTVDCGQVRVLNP